MGFDNYRGWCERCGYRTSECECEDAALDALIVLALRGDPGDDAAVLAMLGEPDFDDIDPDSLPELSPEDRAALERIDIEAIIRGGGQWATNWMTWTT